MIEHSKEILCSVAKTRDALNKILSYGHNALCINNDKAVILPNNMQLILTKDAFNKIRQLSEFDVVELYSDNNFSVYYRDNSTDNALSVTNKCNSSCVMCPCSDNFRKNESRETIEHLLQIVDYMPTDVEFLTITGGEPTLLKDKLFLLMDKIKNHFDDTQFFFLSNGRTFSNYNFVKELVLCSPYKIQFGIPIYGHLPSIHDSITQSDGSFEQTTIGIKNLLSLGCDVEIRIVVTKMNCDYINNIAEYIVNNFSGASHVNIMATEMCGASAKNKERVWIDYKDAFDCSKEGIKTFLLSGMDVRLYNFPLCKVDKGYWHLCSKSITDYKIRFQSVCENCAVKSLCGGVFASTLNNTDMQLIPIKE